jgi:hypothetical protein
MKSKLQALVLSFVLGILSFSAYSQSAAKKSIELVQSDANSISITIKNTNLKYKWVKMSITQTNTYFKTIVGIVDFQRSPLESSAGSATATIEKGGARKILKDYLGFTDADLAQYNFIP